MTMLKNRGKLDRRVYSYNQANPPRDKYHGVLYLMLLIGTSYVGLNSCRPLKEDIRQRTNGLESSTTNSPYGVKQW